MQYEFGDRLKQNMIDEDLSPVQLADALGVNRSAISHLVNNRNKPGFDFITKLRKNFPHWDFDYLVFGIKTKPEEQSIKNSSELGKTHKSSTYESGKGENQFRQNQNNAYQASLFKDEDRPLGNQRSSEDLIQRVEKHVTRTILIYSDGTFEIFSNKISN